MTNTRWSERLFPLVQLLPAVAAAVLVGITLPRTAPVLAAVPQRLEAAASSVEEAAPEQPEEEPQTARLPYADGVYTGVSRGYGGPVRVQVTMENGSITDLQIVSAAQETSNFLRRAKRLLRTVLEAQSWEVDAVSEATYTSRGILGAVKNALTGEVVNNPLPPQPKKSEPPVEEVFETPSVYRDGVYTASAEGYGGPITVQVTIAGDSITDITVVSHAGETSSYFAKGRRVISAILETGTPEGVDAVSGATYSSTGILNAVKQALTRAAGDAAAPEETPAESTASPETEPAAPETPQYVDGTYTGTGETADGTVRVAVTVQDGAVADVQILPEETAEPTFPEQVWDAMIAWFGGQEQTAASGRIYSTGELDGAIQDALQKAQKLPEEPASSEVIEPDATTAQEPPAGSEPETEPQTEENV